MTSSDQHDAAFDHALDGGDDNDEFQSQDDEEEDLAEMIEDDDEDDVIDDLNSPAIINHNNSISIPAAAVMTISVAVPATSSSAAPSAAVTVASVPHGDDDKIRERDRIVKSATATPVATTAVVLHERKPAAILDDSRRLFQRLWTDEDEIELLQGFLDYMTQRGGSVSGGGAYHHYDTALFYDQIKSKLQLDFNKNQLVEKLRRLKKKYRNVVSKITSGKEFNFKSAHDQATFEISRKIWTDIGGKGGSSVVGVDDNVLDDEDANQFTTNMNLCNIEVKSEDFVEKKGFATPSSCKSRPRKRARSKLDIAIDDKGSLSETLVGNTPIIDINTNYINNNNNNSNENTGDAVNGIGIGNGNGNGNSNAGVVAAGVIEETVKRCLSPLFKELLNGAMMGNRTGIGMGGVGVYGGRALGGLAMNAMPLNLGMPGMNIGNPEVSLDDRWRKQQILELEVYSKRLELVQDHIKTSLEELRSIGG